MTVNLPTANWTAPPSLIETPAWLRLFERQKERRARGEGESVVNDPGVTEFTFWTVVGGVFLTILTAAKVGLGLRARDATERKSAERRIHERIDGIESGSAVVVQSIFVAINEMKDKFDGKYASRDDIRRLEGAMESHAEKTEDLIKEVQKLSTGVALLGQGTSSQGRPAKR